MANSSEWIGRFAGAGAGADDMAAGTPDWLALLGDAGTFREVTSFAWPEAMAEGPQPPALPAEPVPDPMAEAMARAFAEGEAAGRAAAAAEDEARAARLRALRLSFCRLDEAALGVLAEDLAATVLALCEGVLGEAARDPAGLRARCEAAARRIGGAPARLVLHLHPDDIALVEEGALAALRLAPDPALEPGSLMIEGPDGTISDGPAEWRRAIAAAVRG